ncbi:MAG: acyl-CoA dehydrogenase family protein [Solirubrobacterales bacterium]
MELSFTLEEQRFRSDVRAWMADHAPGGGGSVLGGTGPVEDRFRKGLAWERELYDAGWAGMAWPREYGGRGASAVEALIFAEELARADAPDPVNMVGLVTAGPTIMAVGNADQKSRFLQAILRAEEVWCQGFSEPDAGSDLASLRTHAERVTDGFEITGQKVWTSFAQFAQRCILLARTGGPGTRGVTCFLVDMTQPGIEVRPLRQLSGESEFNEVRFDSVFVSDRDVLGSVDAGWDVVRTSLANERGISALAQHEGALDLASALADVSARNGSSDHPVVRQALADAYIRGRVIRFMNYRTATSLARGGSAGSESSVTKLFFSEAQRRTANAGMSLLGPAALLEDQVDPASDRIYRRFLWSLAGTIAGGTSEIQRNIIGERVLGLPREPH